MSTGAADERTLLRAWREDGDEEARAHVVHRNLPLARALARRYAGRGEPLEDLEQVASLGLLKAVDRFDCDHGVVFTTFAVPTIAGELKRHFRDHGWMVRVPRDVQELGARLVGVREELTSEHGRAPTVEELAEATGASVERVVEGLAARGAYRLVSLDEPGGDDADVAAVLGAEDDGFAQAEHRMLLRRGLQDLAPREREILRLHFDEGLTQREIARRVGISQMHVSRLLRRSIETLRASLAPPAAAAA